MTGTPGTLEERLRRNSGWRNERHQCVTDPNLLTEAADEIASLRARVEAVETVAEEALDQLWHLAKDPNTNPLVLDLTAVLRTRKEPARQSLKDTPDAE